MIFYDPMMLYGEKNNVINMHPFYNASAIESAVIMGVALPHRIDRIK
jgi:hypothetical protein